MSLYGYDKATNPYLGQLERDSSLVVFRKITAPATTTNKSISSMLSSAMAEGKEYTESYTIPAIAKAAGYQTQWFSNQNESGMADNIVSRFAHLCDEVEFVSTKIAIGMGKSYDEKLIPIVRNSAQGDTSTRCLTIVHLMGQHTDFTDRYPKSWSKFNASQYTDITDDVLHQQTLSNYDNSVAYNDSIVSLMMHTYDDTEAVVLYMSDHSLDIFQTGNYCGHAKPDNPTSKELGLKIPFMIYMSPKYQERFPEMAERVRRSAERPYNTGYLIYTIMDFMGVDFENESVAKHSLFRDE